METIPRKKLLYKNGLGVYCVNAASGCSHGCRYPCYAFMMAKSYNRVSSYEEWCAPKLTADAPVLFEHELAHMRRLPDIIQFSLSTDPFMYGWPEVAETNLRLIEIANSYNIPASVLTKGILPPELADRRRFPADNKYGISLVSLDETFRAKWEPGAAPYTDRIAALRTLHDAGAYTYVHMEPYPTPNIIVQDLNHILESVSFIDELYLGGWNYNSLATSFPDRGIFYRAQHAAAAEFCQKQKISINT